MQITYSNGSIFIRFSSGNTLLAPCTKALASEILTMDENEVEITALLYPDFKEAFEDYTKKATENQFLETLNHERFEFKEGKLYRKGIPLSIPKVLADKIREAITNNDEKELSKLEKFWGWSSLIRHPESRESLFPFIQRQKIQLTDGGEMITYRRVQKKEGSNTALVRFITDTYYKKRAAKKSTNVDVWGCKHNNNFSISSDGSEHNAPYYVGNLKELFHSLDALDGNSFTDNYSKTETYVIGQPVPIMNPKDADWNINNTCSKAYHSSGIDFAYNGFGDVPIACIVNPRHVVACVENSYKMRSLTFTPIAILNSDCEWQDDKEVQKIISEHYQTSIEELEKELQSATFQEWNEGHTLLNELGELDIKSMFTNVKNVITPPDLSNKVVKL